MAKIGIDDLLVAQGPSVLTELINDAWRFDGEPCPERVHLSDIENAGLGRKRIQIDLRVSAIGDSFLLPRVIDLRCTAEPTPKRGGKLRIVRDDEDADEEDEKEHSADAPCAHASRNEAPLEFP